MGQPLEVVYTGVSSYRRVPSLVSADIVIEERMDEGENMDQRITADQGGVWGDKLGCCENCAGTSLKELKRF